MTLEEYESCDATELAHLVRDREVQPAELLDAALVRIERANPIVNAVIRVLDDEARATVAGTLPEGRFTGVPFLLKDLDAALAGVPMQDGSRSRRDRVPDHDCELVVRHKRAGLVIVGKTNTPELGLAAVTEPELHGPTRNPWALDRTPCGSSGGSAAAVAAGIVPMAHGNDGGGSIRHPASACGLFGLKPTRGRNPFGPDSGETFFGLSQDHALTRTVRDSAALLDATQGPDAGAPHRAPPPERPFADEVGADPGRLRIALCTEALLGSSVHPDCVAAAEDAAALCEKLGHYVEKARPALDVEALTRAFVRLMAANCAFRVEVEHRNLTGCPPRPGEFELVTWALSRAGLTLSAVDLVDALECSRLSGRTLARFHETYDLLLTPTLTEPPWETGSLQPSPVERVVLGILPRLPVAPVLRGLLDRMGGAALGPVANTPIFNMTGQPAMSVPLSWNSEGLPIGVQFAARFGDEATLFRLAAQLEAARPWAHKRPPLKV